MADPRLVAAQANDAPYWIVYPSATAVTVGFSNRYELAFTRAEMLALLATLPDTSAPPPEPPKPPAYSLEWRKVTTDKLNVRSTPNGAIVGSLKRGTVVQVNEGQKAGAYVWRKVVGKDWWIAEQYTALTTAPAPEPPPEPKPPPVVVPGTNIIFPPVAPRYSQVGLHIIGWVPEAILFAERMAARGTPIAGAMVADEEKMILALHQKSPRSFSVFRSTAYPDGLPITDDEKAAYALGVQRAREVLPLLIARAPEANAYKLCNEWIPKDNPVRIRAGCAAYRGMMDVANDMHARILVGDWNSGQPQTEREDVQRALHDMLSQAERDGHLVNHHVYVQDGTNDINVDRDFVAMRWLDYLAAHYPDLQAITGEFGFSSNNAAYPGKDALLQAIRDFKAMLAIRDRRRQIAFYVWTLTQHAQRQSDYLRDLETLSAVL